jgi:hypothetical protein
MSRHVGKWGANRQSAPTERCNNPNLALSLAQEGQSSVFGGQERRTPTLREIADRLAQADHLATRASLMRLPSWRGCCALDRPQRQRAASALNPFVTRA